MLDRRSPPMAGPTLRAKPQIKRKPRPQHHLLPAKTTAVYDTYWRFAAERQDVFFKRVAGSPRPWTRDEILTTYKFTNAYRASDRTSQFLIRNVIYRDDLPSSHSEVVFRILLFKLFNKIETWQLLESDLGGAITLDGYSFKEYDKILTRAMSVGHRIYSAAYIMPSAKSEFGHSAKHRNHLRLLEHMIGTNLPEKIAEAHSMQCAFEMLRAYPSIGDFLAYQFAVDINYSTITNFSENDFVIPGPGARDGISKCFSDLGGLNEVEIIRMMVDVQKQEFARLGIEFKTLWGRDLQLIDCQNLFCEVSKYSRVAHPSVPGSSGRTHIKQRFKPSSNDVSVWYPPKWGLNCRVRSKPTARCNTLA